MHCFPFPTPSLSVVLDIYKKRLSNNQRISIISNNNNNDN